jgi:acyl-CoA thioester hydrolase
MPAFRLSFPVEFVDTDALGIVHFSNYFKYFERAEQALLASEGLSYARLNRESRIALPRVEARCRYLSPASVGDQLEVRLWVEEVGRRHVRYSFKIRNLSSKRLSAYGEASVVCVGLDGFRPVELPESLVRALRRYLRRPRPARPQG